jgi:signal transduction histidine kinase
MTNTLRLKLTAGSILKMLTLVALISGGAYMLVIYTIGLNRDQALREKMALEFNARGLPLPAELALPKDTSSPEQDWYILNQIEVSSNAILHTDADLVDTAAVEAAHKNGSDLRTIFTKNDLQLRLLTYRLPPGARVPYLQVSRLLADEDRFKHRLLLILFAGGALFTVLAGGFSWMMTGWSLRATWQAWERQQAFVANASHELRTPLTLIRVSAQVVQQSLAPDSPQRLLMEDVLSETDHMAKLVDDLLLLSRLDASELKLDLQAIQLSALLPRIQRQFVSLANEQGLSVRINRADADGWVKADPTRLRQILLILVDNALRHTPPHGSVTIGAQTHNGAVQISVADTGNGIASKDLPHVFERFYKAGNAPNDLAARRSAGLGLSIAKPLVELHGGEIEIDSHVGIGTRVTITLPAHTVPQLIEISPVLKPF